MTQKEPHSDSSILQILLENTMECFIVVDTNLIITTFNKPFSEFYFRYFNKKVQKGVSILEYALPERRPALIEIYNTVFAGSEFSMEFEVPLPAGGKSFFLNHYKPCFNEDGLVTGAFVTCLDINEKKRNELQLINSEKRYRSLFENSSDGIMLANEKGDVSDISPAGKKILGFEDSELRNFFDNNFIHHGDMESLRRIFNSPEELKDTEKVEECRVVKGNGEYKWIECKFRNQLSEPAVAAVVVSFRDITERKMADELLQKTNAQLEAAQEIAQLGYLEIDLVNDLGFWSVQLKNILGIPASINMPRLEDFLKVVHQNDQQMVRKTFEDALHYRQKLQVEFRIVRSDGKERSLQANLGYHFNPAGKPLRIEAVLQDITERKWVESAIRDSEEKYRYLFYNNPMPMWIYDFETGKFIEVNDEAIYKYGYSRKEFLSMNVSDIRFAEHKGELWEKSGFGESFKLGYQQPDRHLNKSGGIIDVEITSHYIEYERRKAVLVLVNDVTEKTAMQEALIKANARLENAHQIANLGYWELDLRKNTLYWSEELFNIFGLNRSEFAEDFNSFFNTVHPEDKEAVLKQQENVLSGHGPFNYEHRILLKDGSVKTVLEKGALVYDLYGNPIRLEGTTQDISIRKETEQAIRDSEIKYRTIFNSSPLPIWIYEVDGQSILEVNEAALQTYGYSRKEFGELKAKAIWNEEGSRETEAGLNTGVLGNSFFYGMVRHLRKDGSSILLQLQSTVINYDGRSARIVMGLDVTEKMKAEAEVIKAYRNLHAAQEIGKMGYWEYDSLKGGLIWSDQLYTIFNVTTEFFLPSTENISGMIHPNDKRRWEKSWNDALLLHAEIEMEYRILCPDGSVKHIYQKGSPVLDEHEHLLRYEGIIQDISQRKSEQQHLRLLESVITHTTDAVLITDSGPMSEPGPKIIYANAAFSVMTGYSNAEVIGRSPRFLQGPKTEQSELDRLRDAFKNWRPCEIEVINYKKNKEEFWVNLIVVPIADQSGTYTHWISIQRDVTERKRRNQAIARAILTAQEKERYELGSELHDNVNQILATAQVTLGMARGKTEYEGDSWVTRSSDYINMAVDEIRKLSHRLAPPSFDANSMKEAIVVLLQNINVSKQFNIRYYFDPGIEKLILSNELQLNLYRIIQEQLKNILKYSEATLIELDLLMISNTHVRLRINDNGIGFDHTQVKRGIGLNNIRKRAELFHGEFMLYSAPGNGCEIIVEIPVV